MSESMSSVEPSLTNVGFISKAEVAKRLKKTVRTIENWMRLGLLPYYRIGRSICFKWEEVEDHLRVKCRVPRSLEVQE